MSESLLCIHDLKVDLMSTRGVVHALDGVELSVGRGEIHGLVGESGCGKSMTSKSILRLHDKRRSQMSGQIVFDGADLLRLSEKEMRQLRGSRISMIFQDPMTSLNPLLTIGRQISEGFWNHGRCSKEEARKRTLELLEKVGIDPPEKRIDQYPFELSGGLQQRVMIAIAISLNPELLIADEPTTALDVTIQAQILELLKTLQKDMGMSILLITHNFGVVAEICQRVSVMYAGKVVETADVKDIFHHPVHPYSRALIQSIPKAEGHGGHLVTIPGSPPELFERSCGCAFAPRCPFAAERCNKKTPKLRQCGDAPDHIAACHLAEGGERK